MSGHKPAAVTLRNKHKGALLTAPLLSQDGAWFVIKTKAGDVSLVPKAHWEIVEEVFPEPPTPPRRRTPRDFFRDLLRGDL